MPVIKAMTGNQEAEPSVVGTGVGSVFWEGENAG